MAGPENAIPMTAGQKIEVVFEIDLEHSTNFKDWSIVAQGDEGGEGKLTVTPLEANMTSDEWP